MTPIAPGAPEPYRPFVDALLILVRDDCILLAQRQGTGYADGAWNLPSGKLEYGETISQAARREGHEEIGIRTTDQDLEFVHLIHYRDSHSDARVGVFFRVLAWQGEPYNAEPHKCSQIQWWPLDHLPAETYPYTAEGVNAFRLGKRFSMVGWRSLSKRLGVLLAGVALQLDPSG